MQKTNEYLDSHKDREHCFSFKDAFLRWNYAKMQLIGKKKFQCQINYNSRTFKKFPLSLYYLPFHCLK